VVNHQPVRLGDAGTQPAEPPNLNHFTCYPVSEISGGYTPPSSVRLQDEFASGPVPVPIINPTLHLLCFQVSATPIIPTAWDENQFGTASVSIYSTKWLYLPSTKKIVS
jgi:hypothetical protein